MFAYLPGSKRLLASATFVGLLQIGPPADLAPTETVLAQDAPHHHEFTVEGGGFAYRPPRLEVTQDDIVKVTFHATDIAHSFTIDAYRIAKRAGANQQVVFEFRADRPGTFPIYCNLTIDDRCREMRGELIVRPR